MTLADFKNPFRLFFMKFPTFVISSSPPSKICEIRSCVISKRSSVSSINCSARSENAGKPSTIDCTVALTCGIITSRIIVIAPINTSSEAIRLSGRRSFFQRLLRSKNTNTFCSNSFITILRIKAVQKPPMTGVSIFSMADSQLKTLPMFSATVSIAIMQKLINSIFLVGSFEIFIFHYPIVSTLIRLVFPEIPLVIPPVMTILSPFFKENVAFEMRLAV